MLYPKDPSVRVNRSVDSLRIEWNWNRKQGYLALLASAILICIIVAISRMPSFRPNDQIPLYGLGGFYVLFSLGFGLSHSFNRTIIDATTGGVVCYTSPFPWFPRSAPSGSGLLQFFVRPVWSNKSHGWLYVMTEKSECILVVDRIPSKVAAYQICHELQDWHGLEDLPVYGQNTQPHQPGPRTR